MSERLLRHVREHPGRLLASVLVMLFVSLALFGASLYLSFSSRDQRAKDLHDANVANCRNINELRRQLYILLIDSGIARPTLAYRILPNENCEALP